MNVIVTILLTAIAYVVIAAITGSGLLAFLAAAVVLLTGVGATSRL